MAENFTTWTRQFASGNGIANTTVTSSAITYAAFPGSTDCIIFTRQPGVDAGIPPASQGWTLTFQINQPSGSYLGIKNARNQFCAVGLGVGYPNSQNIQPSSNGFYANVQGTWFGYEITTYTLPGTWVDASGWMLAYCGNLGNNGFIKMVYGANATSVTLYYYTDSTMTTLLDSMSYGNYHFNSTNYTSLIITNNYGAGAGSISNLTLSSPSVNKTVSLSPVNVSVGVVVPNKANTKSLGSLSIAARVNAPRLTDPNYWVDPSTLGTVTVAWPGTIQTTTTGMVIGDITTFSYKNSLGITTTGYTGVVNAVADGAIYDGNGGVIGIAYATVLGGATTWGSKSGITSGQFLLGGVQSKTNVNFQGFLFIVSVKKPAVAVNAHVNAPTIIKASTKFVSPASVGMTAGVITPAITKMPIRLASVGVSTAVDNSHTVIPTIFAPQSIARWIIVNVGDPGVSTTANSVVLTNALSTPRNYVYTWPALPTSGTSKFSGHWRLDSTSGSGDYCFTFFKLSQLNGTNLVQVSYKILSTFNSGNPYLQWENPIVPTSGIISLSPVTEMWWEVLVNVNTYTFQAWSDSGKTTQLYMASWIDPATMNPVYFIPWDNYVIGTRTTTGVNDNLAVTGNFFSVSAGINKPSVKNANFPNSVNVQASVLAPTIIVRLPVGRAAAYSFVPRETTRIIKYFNPQFVVAAICNPTIKVVRRRKRRKKFMNTIVRGSTNIIRNVFIENTADGTGLTGLSSATAGLTVYYKRNKGIGSIAVPLVASSGVTLGTYAGDATHGALKEIDAVHMPGLYEFHFPQNSVSATDTSDELTILFFGTGNVANTQLDFSMSAAGDNSVEGVVLTAIPNVAPNTAGGLYVDTGVHF